MINNRLLTICIPTNGIIDWVFPVLDSIYLQNINPTLFEVIVTDNGSNDIFANKMQKYCVQHDNLRYIKTCVKGFLNEIESYKNATGSFIKFVNHRTLMREGSIEYILSFIKNNIETKPDIYFLNGVLKLPCLINEYKTFNDYIRALSIYSSWSTGMGFWKTDFDSFLHNSNFNELFPHTNILFANRDKNRYIIDNNILLEELPVGKHKKGDYNLFYAFAVEYVDLLFDLYNDGDITLQTFLLLKRDNLRFIENLYFTYIFRKRKCSYSLFNATEYLNIFYSSKKIKCSMPRVFIRKLLGKFDRIFKRS